MLVAVSPLTAGTALAAETDGVDVTWGVRTASNDQGTDRQNFEYSVDPGGQVSDALVITNHDTEPLDLDIYAADGFTTSSGQLDVVTRDTKSVALGAWVTLASDHVQIPPGGSVEAPFTVVVPADATPGDYAGGIVTSLGQPQQDQGISVDRRLGIRIHMRVGGELAPSLAVDDMRVDYSGTFNPFGTGTATVAYTVRNTGNVRLTATQLVTLSGPFGLLPITASGVAAVPELLPGETWQVSVPVPDVFPAFLLSANAALTPALPDGVEGPSTIAATQAEATTWAVPWSLLVVIVLVAGLIVLLVLLRKRRKKGEDARVAAAVEKALQTRGTPDDAAVAAAVASVTGKAAEKADSSAKADVSEKADALEKSETQEKADVPETVDASESDSPEKAEMSEATDAAEDTDDSDATDDSDSEPEESQGKPETTPVG
ncbi:WxL protein peptidoglycan domain-containing protein [Compostimonas suwonensis]|nr:DUF916 domain-containing protein [Compostimonas suwonensis]